MIEINPAKGQNEQANQNSNADQERKLPQGTRILNIDGVDMLAYDVGTKGEVPEVFRDKRRAVETDPSSIRELLGKLTWEDFQRLGGERE